MDYKTARLNNALTEAKAICDNLKIPYGDIKWTKINTRAKARWGLCRKLSVGGFEIEIADMLLDPHTDHDALLTTMLHEVLHTCPNCMCHTGQWKVYAKRISDNTKYDIQRCVTAAERAMVPTYKQIQTRRESAKYKITCLHCGRTFTYKRTTEVVKSILNKPINSTCSCPYCRGKDFKIRAL